MTATNTDKSGKSFNPETNNAAKSADQVHEQKIRIVANSAAQNDPASTCAPLPQPFPRPGLARTIVEDAPYPMLVSTVESGRILYVNNAAVRLIGKAPEAGETCYEYALGRTDPCEHCYLKDGDISHEAPCLKVSHYNGKTLVSHSVPADWDGIPVIINYITDITGIVGSLEAVQATSEQIPAGIGTYRIYPDHAELIYANRMLKKLMGGRNEDELPDADIFARASDEDIESVLKSVITFAYSDTESEIRFRLRAKNNSGAVMTYMCRGSVTRTNDSEPLLRLVVIDETLTKDSVSTPEALLESVISAGSGSESVFWLYDIESKRLKILGTENPDIAPFTPPRIYDGVPESIVGSGFIHHEDTLAYLNAYNDIREGKKTAEWTMRMRTFMKDNSLCRVRCKLVRFTDPETGLPMAVGSMAKTEPPESVVLREITEGLGVNAHVIGIEEGVIVLKRYDPSLARIFRYQNGKFPKKIEDNAILLTAPEDQPRYRNYINRVFASSAPLSLDFHVLAADGTVLKVHETSIAVNDPELGRVAFCDGFVTDISASDKLPALDPESLASALSSIRLHIFSANITENRYAYDETGKKRFVRVPPTGSYDDLVMLTMNAVPDEERALFYRKFNRASLLDAYSRGTKAITLEHHIRNTAGIMIFARAHLVFLEDRLNTGDIRCVVLTRDITEENKARMLLQSDGLSGLALRSVFENMVQYRLAQNSGMRCAFIMTDMDKLKTINDTGGHPEGDKAIVHMARAIRETMPEEAVLGRLGGDEFGIFMCPAPSTEEIEKRLRSYLAKVQKHKVESLAGIPLTCSVGCFITFARKDGLNEMLARADAALYAVKKGGRNNLCISEGQ